MRRGARILWLRARRRFTAIFAAWTAFALMLYLGAIFLAAAERRSDDLEELISWDIFGGVAVVIFLGFFIAAIFAVMLCWLRTVSPAAERNRATRADRAMEVKLDEAFHAASGASGVRGSAGRRWIAAYRRFVLTRTPMQQLLLIALFMIPSLIALAIDSRLLDIIVLALTAIVFLFAVCLLLPIGPVDRN